MPVQFVRLFLTNVEGIETRKKMKRSSDDIENENAGFDVLVGKIQSATRALRQDAQGNVAPATMEAESHNPPICSIPTLVH